jgi:hypothetical protein
MRTVVALGGEGIGVEVVDATRPDGSCASPSAWTSSCA